ncbi:MAG TPA: hypothetical protein VN832_12520 [Stellaceae bacterium]|nr:hypothetical protein [Stellaceae bacterium]
MTRFLLLGAAGLLAWSAMAALAAEREPPACAAIAFRPVPSGLTDGEQDAGLYKSRFGRIQVKATVKDGVAQRYFVQMNDKPLTAVAAQDLPKSVAGCAATKRLSEPAKPEDPCLGDRLTVLITHNGDKRYMLLYGHHSGTWHFCSAGIA